MIESLEAKIKEEMKKRITLAMSQQHLEPNIEEFKTDSGRSPRDASILLQKIQEE